MSITLQLSGCMNYMPEYVCLLLHYLQNDLCIIIDELILYNTEQVGILLSFTLNTDTNYTVKTAIKGRGSNIG